MNLDVEKARRGFAVLREDCDPRGHDVLAALENLCVDAIEAVNAVTAIVNELPAPRDVTHGDVLRSGADFDLARDLARGK